MAFRVSITLKDRPDMPTLYVARVDHHAELTTEVELARAYRSRINALEGGRKWAGTLGLLDWGAGVRVEEITP